jgi:hypothetical protein
MKQYRLIEIAPEDGKRYGKKIRTTLFSGPDKAAFEQAIDDYHKRKCKPWAETAYYYGSKRIYAYEI